MPLFLEVEMQQQHWLEDKGIVRALAFVQHLASAEPEAIIEAARKAVLDESRTPLAASLEVSLVAAGRSVEVWFVKDAVQTALYPLQRLAMLKRARTHDVKTAYRLVCEAALALLAEDVIPSNAAKELLRPFETSTSVNAVEAPPGGH